MPMRFKLGLLVLGGLFLFSLLLYGLSIGTEKYEISITDKGFEPQDLVVPVGAKVVFYNKKDEPFWPASNAHPAHTNYPDFDSKKPVDPGDNWGFTFTETGNYRFHDHLHATFEGVITVVDDEGDAALVDCSSNKSLACWEELVTETVETKGVLAAFALISKLSEQEPDFLRNCHSFSHIIGEEAYNLYAAGENFGISTTTSLCGFGFYHGFMETLLLTTGDVKEARGFCRYVDEQLDGQVSAASTACYHGTGHGAVDGSDPSDWGDVDAVMEPGFILCDKIADNKIQKYLCHTGVFNAIDVLSRDPKYGLTAVQEIPFETVCNHQPIDRLEACYTNMVPIVLEINRNDIAAAARYVNEHMIKGDIPTIDGYTTNEMVTLAIFVEFVRLHGHEPGYADRGIELCRRQPVEDQLACIKGLSAGHVKYGLPGKGYIKNLEFCANDMLTYDERDACYGFLLSSIYSQYETKVAKSVCNQSPSEFREKYCLFSE